MSSGLQGPLSPEPKKQGVNAFRQFLTGMARDVPRELKRSGRFRGAIRKVRK